MEVAGRVVDRLGQELERASHRVAELAKLVEDPVDLPADRLRHRSMGELPARYARHCLRCELPVEVRGVLHADSMESTSCWVVTCVPCIPWTRRKCRSRSASSPSG